MLLGLYLSRISTHSPLRSGEHAPLTGLAGLRVVARLCHGHLALVDAVGPGAAGIHPVAVAAASDVEVVVR